MKWIKRFFVFLILLILLLFIAIFLYLKSDAKNPYTLPNPIPVDVPKFTEAEIDFDHKFNSAKHLPVMGAGIIDVDKDGIPELWLGGGQGQKDGLFKYSGNKFINITKDWNLDNKSVESQTYGPAVVDYDNDGDNDLFVCRDHDVYLYTNQGDQFTSKKLNLSFDEKSEPIGITVGDINNDGLVDLFVSAYILKEKMEGQTIFLKEGYGANSLLFANRGNGQFENITESSGLNYTHNTFLGVFIDVDQDALIDLVVAHDTGEARTYKNMGGEKFKMMSNPMTGNYGYPMGIAVGDYNNDSKVDFFFSNTGSTMPEAMLKGDLDLNKHKFMGDWLLFKNEGNFSFSEQGASTDLANFEFSWGAIFEDFNLDGLQDLAVAENYVDLPNFKLVKLPCRFLLNTPSGKFVSTESESGVVNKNFAISPLTADFNQDGYPDLVYSNIAGPARVWINDGGDHNFLKVVLPNNAKSLGAKVMVTKNDGSVLSDWMISGEGLGSDQSRTLVFGLGDEKSIKKVDIDFLSAKDQSIENPKINQTLKVTLVAESPENELDSEL